MKHLAEAMARCYAWAAEVVPKWDAPTGDSNA
jgi:hypothetical protein